MKPSHGPQTPHGITLGARLDEWALGLGPLLRVIGDGYPYKIKAYEGRARREPDNWAAVQFWADGTYTSKEQI